MKTKRVRVEVGDAVTYVSHSGKKYAAIVTEVYEHFGENLFPQVSLEFRNERQKLVRVPIRVSVSDDQWTRRVYLFPEVHQMQGRIFYDQP